MNLGMLSAVGPGMMQGQDALQGIRMKALQIQQAQMAIDAQKRELQGQAALFANMQGLNGLGWQQQPQPQQQAPGQPPQQMSPAMNIGSAGAPPMSSPATAPQAGQPTGGPTFGGTGTPAGGPAASAAQKASQDDFSPMGEFQTMQRIAAAIKARNPGIDNQTLFAATQQALEMMKGVTSAQRPVVQMMGQQERAAVTERGQDLTYGAREDQIRASLQKTSEVIAAQQERTRFIQGEIDRRSRAGQMNRNQISAAQDRVRILASQLSAGQRILGSLANQGVNDTSDPRWQRGQAMIDKAQRGLDALEKGLGIEEAQSDEGANAPNADNAPKVGSSVPLPTGMQNMKDGDTQSADDGTVWQKKGNKLVRVK